MDFECREKGGCFKNKTVAVFSLRENIVNTCFSAQTDLSFGSQCSSSENTEKLNFRAHAEKSQTVSLNNTEGLNSGTRKRISK